MSKSVLISLHYLPLREYISQLLDADIIYIDEGEVWEKQTLRNRTYILGANGIQSLSVPVMNVSGVKSFTKDIKISYQDAWTRVHKGSIFSAYNTSAFFSFFRDDLFDIYDQKPTYLYDLNFQLFQLLLKKLKYKGKFVVYDNQEVDIDLRKLDSLQLIKEKNTSLEKYPQVFGYKFEFSSHLSCLDVISNTGRI